ncbi:MAG: sulfotransferase [Cyclobacteriaceae bacterium]|nr:sulfotransferase [Cyclobacteriaceae bacterium]MDH5249588.1 sulfotransferase [Cyclobacteriaceae bacterium]
MFDFRTSFILLKNSFSLSSDSLRFLSLNRIIFLFLVFPFMAALILANWVFLWLDDVFFPAYRKLNVERNIFVIGLPRSGTTYLLDLICSDPEKFTAFSLGELVFAPSIIQKYFFRKLLAFDRIAGNPSRQTLVYLEKSLFRKIRGIHSPSFFAIEEDEYIFIYLFRSVYLHFLFPELDDQHNLLVRDRLCNTRSGERMMRFYADAIRRHNYVFNRGGQRIFVSKNPAYSGMIRLLYEHFPKSFYINPVRNKRESISSALSLSARLYAMTCRVTGQLSFRQKTISMLVAWSNNMAQFSIQHASDGQYMEIGFPVLVARPYWSLQKIYNLLTITMSVTVRNLCLQWERDSRNYRSEHCYEVVSEGELDEQI